MAATLERAAKAGAARQLKRRSTRAAGLSGADAAVHTLDAMTDPLLWLHGDPTEGRRIRVPEPAPDAAAPPPEAPAPPAGPPRRSGRFGAAVAGGLVSATLVTAGAFGLGVLDRDQAPSASANTNAPSSATVSPRQQGDVAAIYKAASPAVVSIRTGGGSGTGFVVDTDGTIVTNAHVVGDSDRVEVQFADDRTVTGEVRGVDTSSDLAIVHVEPSRAGKLTALELADSSTVKTGQLAVAIGSPFGLPQTATSGIVSGTGRHIQAPDGFQIDSVIQTDAPINPGNSGGPLLDAAGQVIGVNSQIATGGGGNGSVGIGFAVPANTVRDVIPRLERGETIRRAYLGVSTAEGNGGAVVREATDGGPAARAGIRSGDVIVAVADDRIQTPDDVAAAIQDRRPGESIEVQVRRDGDLRTLDVKLAARPTQAP
jgi:putative serine protease PepD